MSTTATSVSEVLALQVRVIGALVLRETRATFGTSHIGYLWAVITPAASVGVLVFIFSLIGRQPPFGESLALFFATGILTLEFFNKLSGTLMKTFDANKALLTYPSIKQTDALFARTILISITYLMIMLIFFGLLIALDLAALPRHPHRLLAAFGATAALGFGFGTLNAVIVSIWASWEHIEKVLTRPLLLVSGVFYIPSSLPQEAIAVLQWNPVLHLVEWMREGYYRDYGSTVFEPTYPLGVAMMLVLLGLAGERLFRKKRA